MFKKKSEKTTIEILISKNEVIALKEDLKNAWSVMQKMDEKLSTAYAAALGGVGSEPITMSEYKFGEGVNDADKS